VAAFVLAFIQRPGLATSDTKIDLHVDPVRFLADVASAWTQSGVLGQVQAGQYSGYLWPMGPFFALGHEIGLSAWVVQRIWLGSVLALAAFGVVRLLDALLERPRGIPHIAAGALYLVNPFVVVYANRTTITLLGYAALPWLLLAVHRGLRDPKRWWWPAAFALLVTSTGGGVNAAVTAWILIGPLLLFLYEPVFEGVPWSAARAFAYRVVPLTLLVSLWWVVPLELQTRYGIDFLQLTEQPGSIWQTTSLPESLRLMGYWVTYAGVGYGDHLVPYFGDAPTLLFNQAVVVCGLLVPSLALAGLPWTRRQRYVPFVLLMLLLGLLVMVVGFPEGTPFRHGLNFTYNHISSVRFLRTTYKAGPLVALALALLGGLALTELLGRYRGRTAARVGLVAGAAALVAVAAWPLVTGRAQDKSVSWKRIPAAWKAAAHGLDHELPANSRAAVLPGQAFSFYTWGGTVDPILPALTRRSVSVKNVPPYADAHATDLFWTVDSLVQQQRLFPGQLRPLLGLMGVRAVVTGTDSDPVRSGAANPVDAARTLAGQGLARASRSYGPLTRFPAPAGDVGAPVTLPQVRRYDLASGRGIVRVEPAGPATVVDGSADGVADLAAFGALPASGAFQYAGDLSAQALRKAASGGGQVVITDSNRRRVLVASRTRQDTGTTLAADETLSPDAAFIDPFASRGTDAQTVAVVRGARYIRAPFSPGVAQFPEHRPFAAFDGDPTTYWASDSTLDRSQHWIEIGFERPRDVDHVDVLPQPDPRARVTALAVNGHVFQVHPGWNRLPLHLRNVSGLRFRIADFDPVRRPTAASGGIAEIRIPGVRVRELLRPPVLADRALSGANLRRTRLTYLFSRTTGDDPLRRSAVEPPPRIGVSREDAEASLIRTAGDGETGIDRLVSAPAARSYRLDAWASVAPGAADPALDRLAGWRGPATFSSSSRFQGVPGWRASSGFDGDPGTAWVGSLVSGSPAWIAWRTPGRRRLTRLRIVPARVARVSAPTRVRLRWPTGATPVLPVGPDGTVNLPSPVSSTSFRLEVVSATAHPGFVPAAVGIASISGPGVPQVAIPRSGALRGACGDLRGTAGTTPIALRVTGTVAQLDAGTPLRATGCGKLPLPAGTSELQMPGGVFRPDLVRLDSAAPAGPTTQLGGGTVLNAGRTGRGSHKDVRLALHGPAWLVLGEGYNKGWRATCDGHSLGTPQVVDGYSNGWLVNGTCRNASFVYAPNKTLRIAEIVSLVTALALLILLIVRRPRAATPVDPPRDNDFTSGADAPARWPLSRALAAGVLAALVFGFVFALRAGVLIGPAVALILWRGIGARRMLLVAAGLLVVAVPAIYLLFPAHGTHGFDNEYATAHLGAHWVAVAAAVLLILALWRMLSQLRRNASARGSRSST
jgi:arabinofuranan 3-O-arabinosyltransferase